MGREAKINNKLTIKQRGFIRRFVENGGNGTQAAMDVYDAKNYNTAHAIASENLQKPTIREAIETALSSQGLTLDVITGNIGELANAKPDKVSGDTVLKANVELLKLHGAYPDKKSYQFNMSVRGRIKDLSYNEAKAELEKIKSQLIEFEADANENVN